MFSRLSHWIPHISVVLIVLLVIGDFFWIRSGYRQYREEAEEPPDTLVCGISQRSLAAGEMPDNFLAGHDDRVVVDSVDYPWSAIGVVYTPSSQCSGVLVEDDLVLTAGHCFPGFQEGRIEASDVWFLAGVSRREALAEVRAQAIAVSPSFVPDRPGHPETDWAFVRLQDPLGEEVGTIPIADPRAAALALRDEQPLIQAGYSTDRPFDLTANFGCTASLVGATGWFTHSCDVLPGDSGSPIMAEIDGGPQVVGVTTDIYCLGNRGADGGAGASVAAFGAAPRALNASRPR